MLRFLLSLSLVLLSAPLAAAPAAEPGVCRQPQAPGERPPVCMDAFFEVLAPWGTFIQTDRYGTLFCPERDRFPPDFRPFAKGHWAMAEEGWTFVGDHPTSWVTDHYGRWVDTELHGCQMAWVPGDVWAPAWVEFHVGERVIAWRPAPFDGVPVLLRPPEGSRLQALSIGPVPTRAPFAGFVVVKDGDFAANRLEDVMLDGPEHVAALREVALLPDARAGLHSQERQMVVAQLVAAKEAQALAQAGPPEPATRLRKGGAVAGSVQKGKAGAEGAAPGPKPGDTPPGSGKVYWGGDQNQSGFKQQGPAGGVRLLEWGKDKKRPLPPPRSPGGR